MIAYKVAAIAALAYTVQAGIVTSYAASPTAYGYVAAAPTVAYRASALGAPACAATSFSYAAPFIARAATAPPCLWIRGCPCPFVRCPLSYPCRVRLPSLRIRCSRFGCPCLFVCNCPHYEACCS